MTMDKTNRASLAVAFVLALVILYLMVGRSRKEDSVPKPLWGYWTTSAPGYENRYLELDDRYILIGVNEEDMPDLQRVSRVECHSVAAQMTCTLYSSNSETDSQMTVDYAPTAGGEMTIKNQRGIVWKRHPDSSGS